MEIKPMNKMKRYLLLTAVLVMASSCYDPYVKDYDYTAVFAAYQYDLRSFVAGEDAAFQFQVALGGVMKNDRDRRVTVELDNTLLGGAVAKMSDKSLISGDYVTAAIQESGVTEFKPLPENAFTLEGMDGLTIRSGRHTAAITIRATEAFLADPDAWKPAYAIAFKITAADADTVLQKKNYAVIAVKCENRYFGYWTRSGVRYSYDWAGNPVGEPDRETASLADSRTYLLTSRSASEVRCNKVAGSTGEMILRFDGKAITISSEDGTISGTGKVYDEALLQDRELYLKYRIDRGGGAYDEVKDTLRFRNRIRDGISEWQDELLHTR